MSAADQPVNPVAVLQSEAARLAEAGEHGRADRMIQASNVVAAMIEAAEGVLFGAESQTRKNRAKLADILKGIDAA